MKTTFTITEKFKVEPNELYAAWLNSEAHSDMTGGEAKASDRVGDSFSAWDGYITGTNIELVENLKIVQSWRTAEFDNSDEDSLLTIEFKEVDDGTELVLTHSNIPEGQAQYEQGWTEHYFEPMHAYFGN